MIKADALQTWRNDRRLTHDQTILRIHRTGPRAVLAGSGIHCLAARRCGGGGRYQIYTKEKSKRL